MPPSRAGTSRQRSDIFHSRCTYCRSTVSTWDTWRIRLVAYGARLESVLGASPRGFESPSSATTFPGTATVPGSLFSAINTRDHPPPGHHPRLRPPPGLPWPHRTLPLRYAHEPPHLLPPLSRPEPPSPPPLCTAGRRLRRGLPAPRHRNHRRQPARHRLHLRALVHPVRNRLGRPTDQGSAPGLSRSRHQPQPPGRRLRRGRRSLPAKATPLVPNASGVASFKTPSATSAATSPPPPPAAASCPTSPTRPTAPRP